MNEDEEAKLEELLDVWEEAKSLGKDITAQQLCKWHNCPALTNELAARQRAVRLSRCG